MSNSIRIQILATAALSAMTLSACGQNANIALKRLTTSPTKVSTPLASPGTLPSPTAPAEPVVIPPVVESKPEPKPVVVVEPKTEPSPQPPVVVAQPPQEPVAPQKGDKGDRGNDGLNGLNGAAGRAGCGLGIQPEVSFKAVNMEPKDYNVDELPLRTTSNERGKKGRVSKGEKIGILKLAQGSPKKWYHEINYVQDSQVLFKFPVSLPPRESMTHVEHAYLELSLIKVSEDAYPDTEWICFLDQKICSGRYFEDNYPASGDSWSRTINPAFWGPAETRASKLYSDIFNSDFKGELAGKFGNTKLWRQPALQLPLDILIKGSSFGGDVIGFLYDGTVKGGPVHKDIKMAVADDTLVMEAKLVLQYEEDTCRAFDLTPADGPKAPQAEAPKDESKKDVSGKEIQ